MDGPRRTTNGTSNDHIRALPAIVRLFTQDVYPFSASRIIMSTEEETKTEIAPAPEEENAATEHEESTATFAPVVRSE